ncbi:hypothetical protein [Nonomuraea cavernae]
MSGVGLFGERALRRELLHASLDLYAAGTQLGSLPGSPAGAGRPS